MNYEILQDRLERLTSEARIRNGAGERPNGEIAICVMQAVDYVTGGTGETDHPPCASKRITELQEESDERRRQPVGGVRLCR